MSLNANFAGYVLARVILCVLHPSEANRAKCLIIKRCLCFIFIFLLNSLVAIKRVIPNLLAHDKHLRLCQHLAVCLEHADFLLVNRW